MLNDTFKGLFNREVKRNAQLTKDFLTGTIIWKPVAIKDFNNSKFRIISLLHKTIYDNHDESEDDDVFYLKVNREDDAALSCIQTWLEVIGEFHNPVIYFVCDSLYLKKVILGRCRFPHHARVTFLGSRVREIAPVCRRLYIGAYWKYTTYAHVFPLWHARIHGIRKHWDIDADDTMFLLPPSQVFKALKQVEAYASEHQIDVFSLDMWRSRTRGKHWSFGVTLINGSEGLFNVVSKNSDTRWAERYVKQGLEEQYNIDWYFTYLKDIGAATIETFYIENSSFIHCSPNPFFKPIYGALYQWRGGLLQFPVILELYQDQIMGSIPIAADVVKFDLFLDGEEASAFIREKYGTLSEVEKKRFGSCEDD